MSRHATLAAGRNRLALGHELRLVEVAGDHVWLEGAMRLRPGQAVELIGRWPGLDDAGKARVVTWRIVRLTDEGPYYRGCCRLEL